jgi:DMSO reductase anchor subunit
MNKTEGNRFLHQVPLLLFTTTAVTAAGLMSGLFVLLVFGKTGLQIRTSLLWTAVLVTAGMLVSLFHLGRKGRFLRAVTGIGHSWLSREVIVAGVFAVSTGCSYLFMENRSMTGLFNLYIYAAVLSALILTITIGMVYNLAGRRSWTGISNWAAPPVTALLLGACCMMLWEESRLHSLIFLSLWLADFTLAVSRTLTFSRLIRNTHRFTFPRFIPFTRFVYISRLFLSVLVMIAALFFLRFLLLPMLIAIVFLDRLAFYAGMTEISPRSEIAELKAERMQEAVKQQ